MTASRSPIVACTGATGAAWPVRSCTTAVSMCAAADHAAATAAARINYAATAACSAA